MATATQIVVTPDTAGIFSAKKPSEEASKKVSELLQENHTKFHIFFNNDGFHNHIPHHLLTLHALSASPTALQTAYANNTPYQRPPLPPHPSLTLTSPATFHQHLHDETYYPDYLAHFTSEIGTHGYPAVINTYLLAGDARADDMLARLFSGVLHPVIHMGYGVEFAQPALVAEGLAEAAVHSGWCGAVLGDAEWMAGGMRKKGGEAGEGEGKGKGEKKGDTLVELALEARGIEALQQAARKPSPGKTRNAVLEMGVGEMVGLAARWSVGEGEGDLEKKIAEVVAFAAYVTAAAQKEGKRIRMDFLCMHCANLAPMLLAWVDEEWVAPRNKVRLVEWYGRMTLALYVAMGSAELRYEEISGYQPANEESGWEGLFDRANRFEDEGHACKLVRALAFGEKRCAGWEGEEWMPVKQADWKIMANMVMDSVESGKLPGRFTESYWIFGAGFDDNWKAIPQRSRL